MVKENYYIATTNSDLVLNKIKANKIEIKKNKIKDKEFYIHIATIEYGFKPLIMKHDGYDTLSELIDIIIKIDSKDYNIVDDALNNISLKSFIDVIKINNIIGRGRLIGDTIIASADSDKEIFTDLNGYEMLKI